MTTEAPFRSWITWEIGIHCPTSQELIKEINRRSVIAPNTIYALDGLLQFGNVTYPQDKQLRMAREWWSNYTGDCSNCGNYVGSLNPQPKCGHIYCDLCKMRGRDEECNEGACTA